MNGNKFSGALHENIRHLVNIKELDLHENSFTGTIPDDVFEKMGNMELIMLYSNQFEGPIPKSLGSCMKLRQAFLQNNGFSGAVPAELGNLQMLEILRVENNSVTGTIPIGVCGLMALSFLTADCKDGQVVCNCCAGCLSLTNDLP